MSEAYDFLWSLDRRERGSRLRLGMAQVRSVEGDPVFGTVSGQAVIVPAANDWFTAEAVPAKYLSEFPPRPGASCWYATDGNDVLILGMVSPEGPPTAVLSRTSATAITTGAASATFPPWETITTDPWNMYDSSGTAIRIAIPGLYSIQGSLEWAAGTVGYRAANVYQNGTIILRERREYTTTTMAQSISTRAIACNAGDLISLGVFHTQGANLNLNSATLGVTYVGRARSTATSNALSTQRFPNGSISAWDTTQSLTATETIETKLGQPAITFTTTAGTNSNIAYSPEVIPVVPRQRYTIAGSAQTSVILGASEGLVMFLLCAPDGVPNPALATSSTASGFSTATLGTANAYYAISNGEQVIPDGCFTARLGIRVNSTAVKVVSFTNLSATEKVY